MDDGQTVDLGIAGLGPAVRIGSGGFADVYRAQQTNLRRDVAVKVLRAAASDLQARMRFERECHALGAVSGHPNIVAVHEGGFTGDGRAYLVMEFCPRGSLLDRIEKQGPMSATEVIEVGTKIGRALGVAHDAGVLHRDVKPANILVTAYGEPALADFGIARVEGGEQTATGLVTASFAHAAPEILQGQLPTAASDLYSLGSTMYELFSGRPAHFRPGDESVWALMNRVISEPMPDPAKAGIPEPLASVIRTATAHEPGQRFASADELVAGFSGGGRPTVIAPPPADPGHSTPPHPNDPEHGKTITVPQTEQMDVRSGQPVRTTGPSSNGPGDLRPADVPRADVPRADVPRVNVPPGSVRPTNVPPADFGVRGRQPRSAPKRRRGPLLAALAIVLVAAGGAAFLLWPRAESLEPLTFSFPDGAAGPLDAGVGYDLIVGGATDDTTYRVLVDSEAIGPATVTLEPFVPTGGRHSVAVEVTRGDEVETTEAVEFYAIGELPPAGYRANLGSVTADPDNWSRAIDRFDQLVEAGHTNVELLPSSRFASLTPGFWNLYVPGFGEDRLAAEEYCAEYGLQIPEACFASRFDPNA